MNKCKEPLHNHHDGCPACDVITETIKVNNKEVLIKHTYPLDNRHKFYSLNGENIIWEESERKYAGKPVAIFNAIRKYQMESPIFRLFVKLGLRK